ncbi:SusE domain-containing protein [Flavobacterium gawalongense]|uniref:SusF/SusE family outer membrane protein n=1 Tax=Flavobacterium gawalongense TaxID=2594432 RepID=A0A553BUA0_9FLAO|nr:SusE domain-containing protein [Flavobacterium gawalongense]TRX02478.1 SusF/SusE family outer membrane protein [Flavobacterium gawalongense]TRX07694.1 SusF/SusE family outer membrane protein [Flavobacterium gawalongense]TRX11823.1 SusF/SusE family outer membrane protein [Flavobacterium gawalongense]TRX13003.1 SusF/SusE family outer membrane protein [Flavobacterium gawalongense]TRX31029.1 SusF/SusE family outer membrane protein [Flavobacterium gawalongense]
MKNITKSIIALFAVVALSCSVEDVQDRPVIEGVDAPVLTAPTAGAAYVLKPENAAAQAERFTWKSANYGGDVQVTYAVEMDTKGNEFKTPQSAGSVISENQVSVTVEQLNNAALLLKATPFAPAEFEVRVKATAGAAAAMYSNVIGIVVTPYTTENPKLWVPGGYAVASGYPADWTPASSPQLSASGYGKVDFEGYVYFNDANAEYKFTSFPEWKGEYAAGATPGTIATSGDNLKIPAAGYYKFNVDTEKLTYTATATAWGIIGDATPAGWGGSTAMTYNKVAKLWTVTATLSQAEMKFRANDAWDINFGDDGANGSLEYGGANIKVPSAGTYTITLDLSSPRNYKYTLTKN